MLSEMTMSFISFCNGRTEDWKNNFDFAARPYKDMDTKWKAHRGFVRVWKSIEPYLKEIHDPTIKKIIIVGYSHGAALAILAHEYVWFNRPDIREDCITYAFEAPRVFKGKLPKEIKERWANCFTFRVDNDIVTHVPPRVFGFRHVGNIVNIIPDKRNTLNPGKLKKVPIMGTHTWVKHSVFDCVNAHWQDNVDFALTGIGGYSSCDPRENTNWRIFVCDQIKGTQGSMKIFKEE